MYLFLGVGLYLTIDELGVGYYISVISLYVVNVCNLYTCCSLTVTRDE